MNSTEPIAHVWFTDGVKRAVYEENSRQYVHDNDGLPVSGVWFIPPEECAVPTIVTPASPSRE